MFDPTRGSYSLGRVLLRRNTLYMIIGWWICNFKSILFNNLTVLTSITGPIIVPPGIAAKFLDCGCAWESVCSLQNGINCRQVRVLYFLPADTLCLNNASSQTLVNWIFSSSDSKSWMFSCKLLPNASFGGMPKVLLLVISHMLMNLWSRILVASLVPFLPLSSRTVHTKSKLLRKCWADSQNEGFRTRVLCLKYPHWRAWFLFLSTFSEFHDSKHWHL